MASLPVLTSHLTFRQSLLPHTLRSPTLGTSAPLAPLPADPSSTLLLLVGLHISPSCRGQPWGRPSKNTRLTCSPRTPQGRGARHLHPQSSNCGPRKHHCWIYAFLPGAPEQWTGAFRTDLSAREVFLQHSPGSELPLLEEAGISRGGQDCGEEHRLTDCGTEASSFRPLWFSES